LLAFVRDVVGVLFGPVRLVASSAASSTLRGLLHRVEQSLGTIRSLDVFDLVVALTDSDRAWLVDSGLVLGAATTYVPAGLSRRAVIARQALASTFFGIDPALGPSGGGAVSFVPRRATPLPFLAAVGYPVFGPRAIRADIAERAAGRLLATTAPTDGAEIATWVGCTIREAHRVAADLVAGPGPAAASGG
jgi:ATP-dependent RNA helicase SUPV3L1/SUV3